jgi:hypothetical protein
VVLQLHGNDVRDDVDYTAGAASLDAGGLPVAVPGPPQSQWTILWRKTHVGHLLRRFQRQVAFHARGRRHTLMVEADGVIEEHPEIGPLTRTALDRLAGEVREAGATLIVFATPSRQAGSERTFHDHVLAWAAERGVPAVSMMERLLPWERLHFRRDIHWNSAGHATVASLLAPVLPGWPNLVPSEDIAIPPQAMTAAEKGMRETGSLASHLPAKPRIYSSPVVSGADIRPQGRNE